MRILEKNRFEIIYIDETEIKQYIKQGYDIKFMRFYGLNKKAFIAIKKVRSNNSKRHNT